MRSSTQCALFKEAASFSLSAFTLSVFCLSLVVLEDRLDDGGYGVGRPEGAAGGAESPPEVRLRRPSALHWPTGARRPFAAAGSGTGGLQPAPPSSPLNLSLQLEHACNKILHPALCYPSVSSVG